MLLSADQRSVRGALRVAALAVAAAALANPRPAAAQEAVDRCGVLVQGVECVLFRIETGERFVISNIGDFQVGDEVRVRGVLDTTCFTGCMEGNGCISNALISTCTLGPFDGCGAFTPGAECPWVFQAEDGTDLLTAPPEGVDPNGQYRLIGTIDQDCYTACLQGWCFERAMIMPCFAVVDHFTGWGWLVNSGDCVLFQSDDGVTYQLEQLGGQVANTRVYVTGLVPWDCTPSCPGADFCIVDNAVIVGVPVESDGPGSTGTSGDSLPCAAFPGLGVLTAWIAFRSARNH